MGHLEKYVGAGLLDPPLSYASPRKDPIELENFASSPVMLNDIHVKPIKN